MAENKISLAPLRNNELEVMFEGAGLLIRKTVGGFDSSDWNRDSFATLTLTLQKIIA